MSAHPYEALIARKLALNVASGLTVLPELPAGMFPHQHALTNWALRRGRAAIFADTGLGKTRMELAWANAVHTVAKHDVLVLAPLAVALQTVQEGEKIGIDVNLCRDGSDVRSGLNITNYDRLHRFDPQRFGAVVLDESSCIKHHDSKTLQTLMDCFAHASFKLCATATPAPNDWTELGTHAEFLGVCKRVEMLSEFFVHDGGETQVWRLKGHARTQFWRWVSSWGAMIRSPADLGFDASAYQLPQLEVIEHIVESPPNAAGLLFELEAQTLSERRNARRASLSNRVEACVNLIKGDECEPKSNLLPSDDSMSTIAMRPESSEESCALHATWGSENSLTMPTDLFGRLNTCAFSDEQWIIWTDLNAEQDAIAGLLGKSCISIFGALDPDEKERRFEMWKAGKVRCLVTKASIFGFGLNMQFCRNMAFVGVTDSYEAYYQAVRRSYRFGQTRPVKVHVFASEAEGAVVANLRRKERDANAMSDALSAETLAAVRSEISGSQRYTNPYHARRRIVSPAWLKTESL